MRSAMISVLTLVLCASQANALPKFDEAELLDLDTRYPFFLKIRATANKPLRYVYADAAQHLHVLAVKDGKSLPEWETASLGSPVTALELVEVGTGEIVLLVATLNGRILVYNLEDYQLLHEHFRDRFYNITCLTAANLDDDPQMEVVFISDGYLYVYDAYTRFLEWKSIQPFSASEILIANVDDDPQPEIILNSGFIIDSRFRELDVESRERKSFGHRIRLIDWDGDGYPEIIGETEGFQLTIFDVRRREEIW